jgi:hypothetical protein
MNYLKHYCNLIRKAENRTPPEGYVEKHHIFPVSIYGKNKRIVILSGREHYIAHALLEKICIQRYGLKHYKTIKMNLAFICMRGNNREYNNSYLYENAKERRRKIKKGKSLSIETRKKLSETGKGRAPTYGFTGKCHTEETKKKMSEAKKGRLTSEETRRKMSEAKKGKNHPHYGKRGENSHNYGRVASEETKKKMSEAHKGKPGTYGMKGKPHTEEFKQKMRNDNPMKRPDIVEKNKMKNRKYNYIFISPLGSKYETNSANEFCLKMGLSPSNVSAVVNGKAKQHKGWTITREKITNDETTRSQRS